MTTPKTTTEPNQQPVSTKTHLICLELIELFMESDAPAKYRKELTEAMAELKAATSGGIVT